MRSVSAADKVVPFRRPSAGSRGGFLPGLGPAASPVGGRAREDQRGLMDAVYATGTLSVAAGDRETKLVASRLQVYGFLVIEEIGADGAARRLRPSEAIRAGADRPWRLSKATYGAGLSVTIPAVDGFLFDACEPAPLGT